MLQRLALPHVFAAVGAAYFVEMFLRWTPPSGLRTTGWDTGVTSLGGVTALGLLLVELTAFWARGARAQSACLGPRILRMPLTARAAFGDVVLKPLVWRQL